MSGEKRGEKNPLDKNDSTNDLVVGGEGRVSFMPQQLEILILDGFWPE